MSRADAQNARSRPPGIVALGVVVAVEAAAVLVLGVLLVIAAFGAANVPSGIAAGVTLLVAGALLAFVARGTFAARPWTRAATIVWQVVQLLVGVYAFQGAGAAVPFGLAAVVPAVVALVLLFTRPVREATARPSR